MVCSQADGPSSAEVARFHFAVLPVATVAEPLALESVVDVEEDLPNLVGELEKEDFGSAPPDDCQSCEARGARVCLRGLARAKG